MGEKRLLLISYHFGPGCPTGGFRWNATAAHLCGVGWNVDAITVARAGLGAGDEVESGGGRGHLEIYPVEAPVWPAAIKTTLVGAGRRIRDWIARPGDNESRAPMALDPEELPVWKPDHRRSPRQRVLHGLDHLERESAELHWALRARRVARTLARRRRYKAVVVCSPPQITQIVGERIFLEYGIPYVADYRDPWILGLGPLISYYPDLERLIGKYYEMRTLRSARLVIHNTDRARAAVANEFHFSAEHIAIPNGYDATGAVSAPDPNCFRVVFTGHLHPFMDTRPVLEACAQLRTAHGLTPKNLRIEFIGAPPEFMGFPLSALADAYGLLDVFSWRDRIPRHEVEWFQQAASVLVAFDSIYPIVVPSKFYEYARMKGTMLLIGHRDGAFNDAASKLGLRVFDPSDQAEINECLSAAFERWRSGRFNEPIDPTGIFDRRHQSERIAEILERLT